MSFQRARFVELAGSVPWRLRGLFVLILLVIGLCLFIVSPYSVRLVAVEKPVQKADFVMVSDTECGQCIKAAAEYSISGTVEGVLIYEEEQTRVVVVGAVPPVEELARKKLIEYGASPESISILPKACLSDWDVARRLNTWLQDHPDKQVRVLSDLFTSQRIRMLIDRTVDASHRSRVTIEGVPDTSYDGTNWWKDRSGVKMFLYYLCRMQYVYWRGEDVKTSIDWSPDKYESSLVD